MPHALPLTEGLQILETRKGKRKQNQLGFSDPRGKSVTGSCRETHRSLTLHMKGFT